MRGLNFNSSDLSHVGNAAAGGNSSENVFVYAYALLIVMLPISVCADYYSYYYFLVFYNNDG